jgi:hypothetical protein
VRDEAGREQPSDLGDGRDGGLDRHDADPIGDLAQPFDLRQELAMLGAERLRRNGRDHRESPPAGRRFDTTPVSGTLDPTPWYSGEPNVPGSVGRTARERGEQPYALIWRVIFIALGFRIRALVGPIPA